MAESVHRLVRVELFEDRAAVTRAVDVPAGRSVILLEDLTPLLRAEAVSVEGSAMVEDLEVVRSLARREAADPEALAALRVAVETAEEAHHAAEDRHRRAAEAASRAQRSLLAAMEAAGRGLSVHPDAPGLVLAVQSLGQIVRDTRRSEASTASALTRSQAEVLTLSTQLDALRSGRPAPRAALRAQVVTDAATTLHVRYVVPCAVWRPAHRATLSDDEVVWEVQAVCWNATGEDWANVELVCSTARPGDRPSPPELEEDWLEVQTRAVQVVEGREERIEVAREGARDANELPGVDDGGETRTYTVSAPASLPSTGQPVVLPLARFVTAASRRWTAIPEKSPLVVLTSRQTNRETRPLLAGPVDLIRDGQAVGRARLGLVPPGEPFRIGWGSHDALRVTRRVEEVSERAMVTGRVTRKFHTRVELVNLGQEAVTIDVVERLPVSEVKGVTVALTRAEPKAQPDEDGMMRWEVALAPTGRVELDLRHELGVASNVSLAF